MTNYKVSFIGGSYDSPFSHINAWMDGAWWMYQEKAKAQAVPEGYVLVNSESLLFHAQSIRMFNDGDWENHYEEIEEHVCAIEEIVKSSESGAEG